MYTRGCFFSFFSFGIGFNRLYPFFFFSIAFFYLYIYIYKQRNYRQKRLVAEEEKKAASLIAIADTEFVRT